MIKEYGLLFRRAIGSQFRKRVIDLLGQGHQLRAVIEPLLSIHEQVCRQQNQLDNEVRRLARSFPFCLQRWRVSGTDAAAQSVRRN